MSKKINKINKISEEKAFDYQRELGMIDSVSDDHIAARRMGFYDGFIAGAEWHDSQMKMPNSTKLISEWNDVKAILQEKDFRGDEWRLAYNAFMFGFTRGINTQTKKEMKNAELKEA